MTHVFSLSVPAICTHRRHCDGACYSSGENGYQTNTSQHPYYTKDAAMNCPGDSITITETAQKEI